MAITTNIVQHATYPDTGCVVIFDVYAGDDPRDYMMRNYKPMSRRGSFKTLAEAVAFAAELRELKE